MYQSFLRSYSGAPTLLVSMDLSNLEAPFELAQL